MVTFALVFLANCTDSIQHDEAMTRNVAQVNKQSKILPYPIYQTRLGNGLNIVTVPFDRS